MDGASVIQLKDIQHKINRQILFIFFILCLVVLIPDLSEARRKKSSSNDFQAGTYIPGHVYVKPHFKTNGTFVEGHRRTRKNSRFSDNWSTYGNINPYTGKRGTKRGW